MSWSHMWLCSYSTTHYYLITWNERSASHPSCFISEHIVLSTSWTAWVQPNPIWTLFNLENSLVPAKNRTHIPLLYSSWHRLVSTLTETSVSNLKIRITKCLTLCAIISVLCYYEHGQLSAYWSSYSLDNQRIVVRFQVGARFFLYSPKFPVVSWSTFIRLFNVYEGSSSRNKVAGAWSWWFTSYFRRSPVSVRRAQGWSCLDVLLSQLPIKNLENLEIFQTHY